MEPPRFPKLDPAGAQFWEVRYREHFTPWDAGHVPRQLRDYVRSGSPPGRVLVPGCGAAYEVRFFCEAGWNVDGIDFSPAAIEAALPVLGPFKDRVRLADFFGAEVSAPFALVYERAFLCALPRRLWGDWARRLTHLIPHGGRLAGFFYMDSEVDRGPPFALRSQTELDRLLSDDFKCIEDAPVPDSVPVFANKERWQIWQRR